MVTRFRLNTLLTKQGFTNTTPDFGMGKTNATWQKGNIKIQRRQAFGGSIEIYLYKGTELLRAYSITGVHGPDGITNFKTDLSKII